MENFKFGVELMFDLDVKIVEKQIETLLQNQAVKLLFDSVVESKDVHTLLHVYLNTVKPQDFINYYMKTGCADAYTYTLNDEHTGRSKTQLMNNIQYHSTFRVYLKITEIQKPITISQSLTQIPVVGNTFTKLMVE
jgi:hypothetical protein